jgi:hypothetical protein
MESLQMDCDKAVIFNNENRGVFHGGTTLFLFLKPENKFWTN